MKNIKEKIIKLMKMGRIRNAPVIKDFSSFLSFLNRRSRGWRTSRCANIMLADEDVCQPPETDSQPSLTAVIRP